ncbi:MAG: SIS domain-containing protein [bacterium]
MDLREYFKGFDETLKACIDSIKCQNDLEAAVTMIKGTKNDGRKIILVGNGGSAAIAEHMAIDFTKNAGLRAMTISGSPQLTTFANDYGYEHIYSKGIEAYADKGDVVIAISSGGTSKNIINAVDAAKKVGCKVITFSGFEERNPLRSKGDINIYVASEAYGYVEIIHNLLIHYLNDQIIGKAVYKLR